MNSHKFFLCLLLIALSFFLFGQPSAFSDEIYLKNGDRISGTLTQKTDARITIESEVLGTFNVDPQFIDRIESQKIQNQALPKREETPISFPWKKTIDLGYSQAGGNTKTQNGSAKLAIHRKTDKDEWTLSAQGFYGSSDKKLDTKKYNGLLRYAQSFGSDKKWYNFYKVEGNRDEFANIDYRILPAVGVGYWFSDKAPFKAMAEGAIGFEHTNYRDSTESSNKTVLVPRVFFEKTLLEKLILAQDITLYPSLSEFGEYRLSLKTELINALSDASALKVSFIDEFNSNPPEDTKKNDFRIISSVVYSF